MRFSNLAIFALSGLSIASPVVTKRDTGADVVNLLTVLYATVCLPQAKPFLQAKY
jgi:hypothetical protein